MALDNIRPLVYFDVNAIVEINFKVYLKKFMDLIFKFKLLTLFLQAQFSSTNFLPSAI